MLYNARMSLVVLERGESALRVGICAHVSGLCQLKLSGGCICRRCAWARLRQDICDKGSFATMRTRQGLACRKAGICDRAQTMLLGLAMGSKVVRRGSCERCYILRVEPR